MSVLRDIKARARRDTHFTMAVPASYYATKGATPLPVHVRVHTKFDRLGELRGIPAAERADVAPKLIFWREELGVVTLVRNAVVVIEAEQSLSGDREGYHIDAAEKPDGLTQTASVTPIKPDKIDESLVP